MNIKVTKNMLINKIKLEQKPGFYATYSVSFIDDNLNNAKIFYLDDRQFDELSKLIYNFCNKTMEEK